MSAVSKHYVKECGLRLVVTLHSIFYNSIEIISTLVVEL